MWSRATAAPAAAATAVVAVAPELAIRGRNTMPPTRMQCDLCMRLGISTETRANTYIQIDHLHSQFEYTHTHTRKHTPENQSTTTTATTELWKHNRPEIRLQCPGFSP